MTEIEKIAYAKMFIDKLANGINPINDLPVSEDDIVNNVRLTRCFFYVSDILRQVIENGGTTKAPKPKSKKLAFYISSEQLSQYEYSETPISASEIIMRINKLIDTEQMNKLTYKQVANWLVSIDVLAERSNNNGRVSKLPTVNGEQLGITMESRQGMNGEYKVVVYNKEAQSFILNNMPAIISFNT